MTDATPSPGTGPAVCPFVALAEDRDRRADAPDEGNRCYAERAPRRRDLVYQSDYCYSLDFSSCPVFLAWAARSAAEPAFVTEAAQKAWGSGISAPEEPEAGSETAPAAEADDEGEPLPPPTPEGGLFGPADTADTGEGRAGEQLDWISASAWAQAPWDERAEQEADELEALSEEEELEDELEPEPEPEPEEALQAPKVPAALPMRRRKAPQQPIRSRGSGEWFYADPPGHEPLVSRRRGVTPPILLAVLGLLVVSIVVFLVAMQLGGGDPDQDLAAAPSPSAAASLLPSATSAPVVTAAPSAEPSATPKPKTRYYRVKAGDSLSSIAAKFDVDQKHLQCLNGILNKNIVVLGARYQIPPEGYTCPSGWRKALEEGS